jgi:rSAM/selenodomain-associated transferase 2
MPTESNGLAPLPTSPPATISIIVPTLNEARFLGATLDVVCALPCVHDVIVVDGGSMDKTVPIARAHGVRVFNARRGRGVQLHAGARLARGDILWFIHADTLPSADAPPQIVQALARVTVQGGCCSVRFDSASPEARFLAFLYARLRRFGLCYGDATLFVRRRDYEQMRGYRPFPLFEDVDLVRRLRQRGRLICLRAEVIASSRRFEGGNFVRTLLWRMVLQLLYWLGVPPHALARLYVPVRSRRPHTSRLRRPV